MEEARNYEEEFAREEAEAGGPVTVENGIIKPAKSVETKKPITAVELMKKDFPPINWIVEGLLPAGLVKLCGEPKSYKSYMAMDLCLSACLGRKFLGRDVKKCGALYYDLEGTERRAKTRIQQLLEEGEVVPDGFYIHTGFENYQLIGEGFEERLRQELDIYPDIGVVVIDVWLLLRPTRKQSELLKNEYLDSRPLWKIAQEKNVCIVLVEHTNKNSGASAFNRIAGPNTSRGSTDANWVITREEDENEAKLSVEGREVFSQEFSITWNCEKTRWEMNGLMKDRKLQQEKERQFAEYTHNNAVKLIREGIRTDGLWSGTVGELAAEAGETASKFGCMIRNWDGLGFFKAEGISLVRDSKTHGRKYMKFVSTTST